MEASARAVCAAQQLPRAAEGDLRRGSSDLGRASSDLRRLSGDVEELLQPILEEGEASKAFTQLVEDELQRVHRFYVAKVPPRVHAHCAGWGA